MNGENPPPEEDFSKLPLRDQLSHKNWKARKLGYESLLKLLKVSEGDDDVYNTHASAMKGITTDTNLSAQEKGLEVVLIFLKNAHHADRVAKEIVEGLIPKCVNSSKKGTKELAIQISLACCEIGQSSLVVDEMINTGLSNKQPKVVASCINILRSCIENFGPKTVNPKAILEKLTSLFGHSDKDVRAQATALTVELYKWIRDPVLTYISSIKPVQLKELQTQFDKLGSEKPIPNRLTRKQQEAKRLQEEEEARQADFENEKEEDGEPNENECDSSGIEDDSSSEDAMQFLPEIDPSDRLGPLYQGLDEKKWSIRKDALDEFSKSITNVKLVKKDYTELITRLKKLVVDVNINVAMASCNVITNLSKGLGPNFSSYCAGINAPLIERCKEKKKTVLEAVQAAMDAVFDSCTSISDLAESIIVGLSHKNPAVRKETLDYLYRCMGKIEKSNLSKATLMSFADNFAKLVGDSSADVRESAMKLFGICLKLIGEAPLLKHLEGIDKIKEGKIREHCEAAVVKTAKPPKLAPKKAKRPATSTSTTKKIQPKKQSTAASTSSSSTSSVSAAPSKSRIKSSKPKKAKKAVVVSESVIDEGSADSKISNLLSQGDIENLSSKLWKERLASMQNILETCKRTNGDVPVQALFNFLSRKPGFKDVNFQVIAASLQTMLFVADKADSVSRQAAEWVINGAVEKLGDMKNQGNASDLLLMLCERVSPSFVTQKGQVFAPSHKNPKVFSGFVSWMGKVLEEFGFHLDLKANVEFAKTALGHSNAAVRKEAFTFIGRLRLFVGPKLRTFFEDLKPAILTSIDAEFEKVSSTPKPKPQRFERGTESASDESSEDESPPPAVKAISTDKKTTNKVKVNRPAVKRPSSSTTTKPAATSLVTKAPKVAKQEKDEYSFEMPRVDISSKITSSLLKQMGDSNWKQRNESLQTVESILKSSHYSIEDKVGDLPVALAARHSDNNKNLIAFALRLTGELAKSLGSNFTKHTKKMVPTVLSAMNDNKITVKDGASKALTTIFETVGLDHLLTHSYISIALNTDSPGLRTELLGWMCAHIENDVESSSLLLTVDPLFRCLEDRNNAVRTKAQCLAVILIEHCTFDVLKSKLGQSSLSMTSKSNIGTILEKSNKTYLANKPKSIPKVKAIAEPIEQPIEEYDQPIQQERKSQSQLRRPQKSSPKPQAQLQEEQPLQQIQPQQQMPKMSTFQSPDILSIFVFEDDDDLSVNIDESSTDQDDGRDFKVDEEILIDLLGQCINRGLLNQTVHEDPRQQTRGLQTLIKTISPNKDTGDLLYKNETLKCSEVFLYLCQWLMLTPNANVRLKSLEFLGALLQAFTAAEFNLNEHTKLFLRTLIEKLGDPKETIKTQAKTCLKLLCGCYSSKNVFSALLVSCTSSKNLRCKVGAIEEMEYLIDQYKNCATPNNAIEKIALLGTDPSLDKKIRNASLQAIQTTYSIIGEKIFSSLSLLNSESLTAICQHLKVSLPSNMAISKKVDSYYSQPPQKKAPSTTSNVSTAAATTTTETTMENGRMASLTAATAASAVETPNKRTTINESFNGDTPTLFPGDAKRTSSKAKTIDMLLTDITFCNNPTIAKEASQEIQERLFAKDKKIMDPSICGELLSQTVVLFRFSFQNLYDSFSELKDDDNVDFNTPEMVQFRLTHGILSEIVQNHSGFHLVKKEPLSYLYMELLDFLGDDKLCNYLDMRTKNSKITTALSTLLKRTLVEADITVSLEILIGILTTQSFVHSEHYVCLVFKSLWRLCKPLKNDQNLIKSVDWTCVFTVLNEFFLTNPPTIWGKQSEIRKIVNDQPLRTAKTIVSIPIKSFSPDYFDNILFKINAREPSNNMYTYVLRFIQQEHPSYSFTKCSPSFSNKENFTHNQRTVDELALEVKLVFERMVGYENIDKDTLDSVVKDLFDLKQVHPDINELIEKYIEKCPSFYRNYLKRNLSMRGYQVSSSAALQKKPKANEDINARLDRLKEENIIYRNRT